MNPAHHKERIFVKLLLPYLAGLLLAWAYPLSQLLWPMGMMLAMLSVLLFIVHHKRKLPNSKSTLTWAFIFYGWLVYMGFINTLWANPTITKHHYTHSLALPGVVLVQLEDKPEEKSGNYTTIAKVVGKHEQGNLVPITGKVILRLPADSRSSQLTYGDVVAINAPFQPIAAAQNPFEFDYRQYLANKHIYHQLSPKIDRWYTTGNNTGHWFWQLMLQTRAKAVEVLREHLPQPEHLGVASAMLLGYKGGLDSDTRQLYTITGSMHVLAVSGMHVALLCFLLGWVLLPLRYFQKPWLRLVILLVIIWLYTFFTGMSASVLRAAIMFSLFALGETLMRKTDSINILSASALIILLWDPLQLLDVGFQLSYLAVMGIVFLYKPLRNLWPIKHKVPRLAWEGTCVSIAAQVATLPLVLYYFHQMPVYALLANLGMLLLAPAVMFAGIGLLVLFWVPGLGYLLGKILWFALWVMDEMLSLIAALPNAAIKAIYPSALEMGLLFGIIISITVATRMRPVKPLMAAFCFTIILVGAGNYRLMEQKHQQQLVVYQYPNSTAIATLNGRTASFWADSAALADTAQMQRRVYPFLHANGIGTYPAKVLAPKANEYGMVGNKRFALLRKYTRKNLPAEKLEIDYLIISSNVSIDMQQVQMVYRAQTIVLDGSNNAQAVERWLEECKVLGLDCHSTRARAFIASW